MGERTFVTADQESGYQPKKELSPARGLGDWTVQSDNELVCERKTRGKGAAFKEGGRKGGKSNRAPAWTIAGPRATRASQRKEKETYANQERPGGKGKKRKDLKTYGQVGGNLCKSEITYVRLGGRG